MSENTLDRLDREHGDARQFVAEQIVGGASNAQVADAIAAKFGIDPPTIRSVSQWSNHDKKLLAKVAELREGGADATRATATVIAALEARLENPDSLSVSELIEIKKALARQSNNAAAAEALRGEGTTGLPREVIDYLFFVLAHEYGDEGAYFADVCVDQDASMDDVLAAFPADADVEQIIAEGESNITASASNSYGSQ